MLQAAEMAVPVFHEFPAQPFNLQIGLGATIGRLVGLEPPLILDLSTPRMVRFAARDVAQTATQQSDLLAPVGNMFAKRITGSVESRLCQLNQGGSLHCHDRAAGMLTGDTGGLGV